MSTETTTPETTPASSDLETLGTLLNFLNSVESHDRTVPIDSQLVSAQNEVIREICRVLGAVMPGGSK